MTLALRMLPALAGAKPGTTPRYSLRSVFDRTDPPDRSSLLSRFDRGVYRAGQPGAEPKVDARPLTFLSIRAVRSDFARGRHEIIRETS